MLDKVKPAAIGARRASEFVDDQQVSGPEDNPSQHLQQAIRALVELGHDPAIAHRSKPLKQRVEIYRAAIAAAIELAAVDVLRDEFLRLAEQSGLAADLKQHADLYHSDKTLEHVLRWGLLRRNPFR